ncbi:winged helix-turn-helix domain-containing protein [Streptomyces sp. NBC_00631]|uniref:hypothetical protein n=1 Tax=Streptomyces sp. NBC_00631 TaxID=2975793 RepID=UPI0030E26237
MLIVAADLRDHPRTTVTEIAKRTGLAQSQVSDCAAGCAAPRRASPNPTRVTAAVRC